MAAIGAVHSGAATAGPRLRLTPAALVLPLAAVMLAFYVAPLVQSVVNSFHPYSLQGIDFGIWTLDNYARLVDPFYAGVFLRTLRVSLVITAITAALAYPVALWLVRLRPRLQAAMLLVYVAPWLINTVVKAFGWTLLLGGNGVINGALKGMGFAPVPLMLNETGIVIGLVHGHFMFILLPLWAALSSLDPSLSWAAGSLGARPARVFLRVVLPLTLPALLAGAIINFTMNMAAFATPALLGGSRARVLSFVAYEVNLVELNWPLGGAMAVALLAVTLLLVRAAQRIGGRRPA
jgi:putative spermidine/putrescine transport system permease protein